MMIIIIIISRWENTGRRLKFPLGAKKRSAGTKTTASLDSLSLEVVRKGRERTESKKPEHSSRGIGQESYNLRLPQKLGINYWSCVSWGQRDFSFFPSSSAVLVK